MDKLMNLAAEHLAGDKDDKKHSSSNSHSSNQVPPSGNKSHGGAYPLFKDEDSDDDDDKLAQEASRRAGSSGNSDMFASVLGMMGGKKKSKQAANDDDSDIDEEYAVKKHKKNFKDEDDDEVEDSKSLGTAAAMQALKMFSQGDTGGSKQSQGAFMAMAMAEAVKLFDNKASQGKVAPSASKESAAQQAAQVALKMYFQSQGEKKGGSAGLLQLASKFM
jgi:hypothetical protein